MDIKFPQPNDPKLAEFIGIMLGDGSMSIKKIKGQNRIKITFNSKEQQYINFVKNLIEKLFNVTPILKFRKKENTADLFIFRRGVINHLMDLGLALSPKRNNAKIPESFLNNDLELDVLRGCFDTDGSVVLANNNGTLYPRLEIKVCPSPMQKQIPEILCRRGFRFGVYDIVNGEKRIQMNGKSQLEKWIKLVKFSNIKHITKANRILKSSAGWNFSSHRFRGLF